MVRTIMVPLDGSRLAERALPYAAALARAGQGKIIPMRVIQLPVLSGRMDAENDVSAYLKVTADALKADGVDAEPLVHFRYLEDVGQSILNAINAREPDLVVMSTHGRGGVDRWIHGSVAERVMRQAPVPLVLVSPQTPPEWPDGRLSTVLVPLDGSDLSAEALEPAASLAATLGAELLLLKVVEPPNYAYAEGYAYLDFNLEAELKEAQRALESTAAELRGRDMSVSIQVASGSPVNVIADVAEERRAGLVVMATHGRSGLPRLVLGSVTAGTLQRARVPVMIVRPSAVRQATESAAEAAGAEPETRGEVTLSLTRAELELLERGLGDLLYTPGRDWHVAEPARKLLLKLKQAGAGA